MLTWQIEGLANLVKVAGLAELDLPDLDVRGEPGGGYEPAAGGHLQKEQLCCAYSYR